MANPTFVDCPNGQWTKIATNVMDGNVHLVKVDVAYFQAWVETGDPAPVNFTEGVQLFDEGRHVPISATIPIDVYVWVEPRQGRVRVDV